MPIDGRRRNSFAPSSRSGVEALSFFFFVLALCFLCFFFPEYTKFPSKQFVLRCKSEDNHGMEEEVEEEVGGGEDGRGQRGVEGGRRGEGSGREGGRRGRGLNAVLPLNRLHAPSLLQAVNTPTL